jgi:hypothetical protein
MLVRTGGPASLTQPSEHDQFGGRAPRDKDNGVLAETPTDGCGLRPRHRQREKAGFWRPIPEPTAPLSGETRETLADQVALQIAILEDVSTDVLDSTERIPGLDEGTCLRLPPGEQCIRT